MKINLIVVQAPCTGIKLLTGRLLRWMWPRYLLYFLYVILGCLRWIVRATTRRQWRSVLVIVWLWFDVVVTDPWLSGNCNLGILFHQACHRRRKCRQLDKLVERVVHNVLRFEQNFRLSCSLGRLLLQGIPPLQQISRLFDAIQYRYRLWPFRGPPWTNWNLFLNSVGNRILQPSYLMLLKSRFDHIIYDSNSFIHCFQSGNAVLFDHFEIFL